MDYPGEAVTHLHRKERSLKRRLVSSPFAECVSHPRALAETRRLSSASPFREVKTQAFCHVAHRTRVGREAPHIFHHEAAAQPPDRRRGRADGRWRRPAIFSVSAELSIFILHTQRVKQPFLDQLGTVHRSASAAARPAAVNMVLWYWTAVRKASRAATSRPCGPSLPASSRQAIPQRIVASEHRVR